MSEFTDRLKSRKFLLAVFGLIGVFLTEVLGIPLSQEAWNSIVSIILGYIAAEGVADTVERYGMVKNGTEKTILMKEQEKDKKIVKL